jgi:hypothetical protein
MSSFATSLSGSVEETEGGVSPDDEEEEAWQLQIAVHAPVLANRQTAILAHPIMWMAAGTLVFVATLV